MQLSFQMLGSHEERHPRGERVFKAIFLNSIQHSLQMPFKNNTISLPLQGSLVLPLPGESEPALEREVQLLIFDTGLWTVFLGRQIREPSIPAHGCRRPPEVWGAPGAGAGSGGFCPPVRRPRFQRCQPRSQAWVRQMPSLPDGDRIPCERLRLR